MGTFLPFVLIKTYIDRDNNKLNANSESGFISKDLSRIVVSPRKNY